MTTPFRTLTALGALAAALCIPVAPASAAVVHYSFTVVPDDPSVTQGTGSFSFDDAQVPAPSPFGDDLYALSDFSFSFGGNTYLLAGLDFGDAVFSGGQFVGLDAAAGSLFSLVPGSPALADAYFAYELAGQPGYGTVTYTQDNQQQVPEPATAWLALLALAPLARRSRAQRSNACKVVQNHPFK
jgi:hypothetical protein